VPPKYVGPYDALTAVVGESRNEKSDMPGSWLPFTSRTTTQFARDMFGKDALNIGWTNMSECPPQSLRKFNKIIACGKTAAKWVNYHVDHDNVLEVSHPSWLYRWKAGRERLQETKNRIHDFMLKGE